LTGEAGNASRRKVIVEATARSLEWASAWRTQDESGPTFSRVIRTNFGDRMAKIFRENSDSLVYFLGQIAKQDLPAYYHACDIFCLPSIDQSESFGIAQLEAMACSKPVVCCDVTQATSNLNQDNETGFVVPPRCPISLANAVRQLYQEPLLRYALGRSAYKYAKERFTTKEMVQQVKALYEQIGIVN
jgi:glycosyltransferase involved in cell wall biosynthesis